LYRFLICDVFTETRFGGNQLLVVPEAAGLSDELARTVDYGRVFDTCRQIVESTRFDLVEALAEAIAQELLSEFPVDEVTVRVRKPMVKLGGTLRAVGVEIRRRRPVAAPPKG